MTAVEQQYVSMAGPWSDIQGHLPRMVDLVVTSQARHVIELGVRSGVSTAAWLWGVEQTDGWVWSVDVNPGPTLMGRWTFIQGNDADPGILKLLPETVDIVFVDTDHTYELTKQQIELYVPRVKSGGHMVFHDTALEQFEHHTTPQPLYPVRTAVWQWIQDAGIPSEEAVTTYDDFYGLTIVRIP